MSKVCDKCEGVRIIEVFSKTSDMNTFDVFNGDRTLKIRGYVVEGIGMRSVEDDHGEDYLDFSYCLDCGKIQGQFPVTIPDFGVFSVELDTCLDLSACDDSLLINWCQSNDVDWTIINESGPGGGNPVIEFMGSKDALEEMIEEFWEGGDPEYLKTLIGQV